MRRSSRSNELWEMDVTHVPCGQDGREQLVAVMDCHDREMISYEFARRSRAKEARARGRSGMPPTVWHAPARRYIGHTERQ